MQLPFQQGKVVECYVEDYSYRLVINSADERYTLKIEADPTLAFQNGGYADELNLDYTDGRYEFAENRDRFPEDWDLIEQQIQATALHEDGAFDMTFSSGARLHVPGGDKYEAWELNGPGNQMILSEPGRRVSVWGQIAFEGNGAEHSGKGMSL